MFTYESSSPEHSNTSCQPTTSRAALIYARTASPDRGRYNPVRDVSTGLAAAAGMGLRVSAVVVETRPWGVSEGVLELLLQHDVVIVSHMDRLARGGDDMRKLLRRLTLGGVRLYEGATEVELVQMPSTARA